VDDHLRAEEAVRESERQLRKARDKLETKVAERTAELQHSEAYLAEAQRLSHAGSFGWDISSGKLYWSEELTIMVNSLFNGWRMEDVWLDS
jgi:hypothetical protein